MDGKVFDVDLQPYDPESAPAPSPEAKQATTAKAAVVSGPVTKLKAPIPGVVFKVVAKEGDKVNAGDAIIILEAMKMENAVGSPVDGTITEIKFKEGDQVAGGDVLAIIE